MVLGKEVADWINSSNDESYHTNNDLGVWHLGLSDKGEVLGNIMGHLRSACRSSIFVFNHSIVQLWRHGNNHVIKIWIEVSSFGNVKTEWRIVVVTCEQVVGIVNESWLMGTNLR